MNKREFLIIVSIILIIFLAGCKPRGARPDEVAEGKIYRGTNGLEMKFMKDLPPSKIYDLSALTIVAELENKGVSDLSGSNCMLHLHGYDDNIIRGIDKNKYCGANLWDLFNNLPILSIIFRVSPES